MQASHMSGIGRQDNELRDNHITGLKVQRPVGKYSLWNCVGAVPTLPPRQCGL